MKAMGAQPKNCDSYVNRRCNKLQFDPEDQRASLCPCKRARPGFRAQRTALYLFTLCLCMRTCNSFLLSPFTNCFGLAALSKVLNPVCIPQQADVGTSNSFTFHTEDGRVVVINLASDPVYRCSRFSSPDLSSVNRHDSNSLCIKDGMEAVCETQGNKHGDKLYLKWRGSYRGDGMKFSQMIESPFLQKKGAMLPQMYPLPEDLINKDGIVGLAAFLSVYDFELVTDFRKMGTTSVSSSTRATDRDDRRFHYLRSRLHQRGSKLERCEGCWAHRVPAGIRCGVCQEDHAAIAGRKYAVECRPRLSNMQIVSDISVSIR
eukprot:226780-Hanusia_phi.AAC.1